MAPTQKQIELVGDITRTLGIEFPISSKQFSRFAYSRFINLYLDEYIAYCHDIQYVDEDMCLVLCSNDIWCEYY